METPVLETKRLILRPLRESDSYDIWRNIRHDKEVLRFYLDSYKEKPEDSKLGPMIEFCKKNEWYLWAIELKESGEVIGLLNQCNKPDRYFHTLELGYAIGQPYWNKGYMSEALPCVCDYLFKKGVHKICCRCIRENTASARVMEKAGFRYEGESEQEVYYHDKYWDLLTYSLLSPFSD